MTRQEGTLLDGRQLGASRVFHRAMHSNSGLDPTDRRRLEQAVDKFVADSRAPGLKFKKLSGKGRNNLWSIRASQGLRIILARNSRLCLFVNAGQHDAMYAWAERRGYYLDPETTEYTLFPLGTQEMVQPTAPVPSSPDTPDGRIADISEDEHEAAGTAAVQHDLARMLKGDFEEWMLFLHPDQRHFVSRHWTGPARVRGAAGTGKTVVALHRAAALAHLYPDETVLFTTFSRSLCTLLQERYHRLPNAPANVEFTNIDRIAYEFSSRVWANETAAQDAFNRACQRVMAGSVLESFGPDYLKDEIERVIKGRDVQNLDEYLKIERLGRKRSFPRNVRTQVWELSEIWDRELQGRNVRRFADTALLARDRVRHMAQAPYRCVIVDEAQDLTLVQMQLVRALVAGAPCNPVPDNGILMLDDAAQRIYAGGFRPKWAGLEVKGRSYILRRNYRNVQAVYNAARRVRGDVLVAVEDEDDGAVIDAEFELDEGSKPEFVRVSGNEALFMAQEIEFLTGEKHYALNEIGIFLRTNEDARKLAKWLAGKHQLACVLLAEARDRFLDEGIRIGTFDRAKGLEFRAVFIPRMAHFLFPVGTEDAASDSLAEDKEQDGALPVLDQEARLLELDRLYVAMTRAREYLYLVGNDEPCAEIQRALDKEIEYVDCRSEYG